MASAVLPQIELVLLPADSGPHTAETEKTFGAKPLPSMWRRHGLFIGIFLLPVFIATLYFAFIASDVYVSETKFILRSPGGTDGGLSSLSQGQVSGRSDDDAYALIEYITSRDAARAMELDHRMKDFMSRDDADFFNRYPSPLFEDNQESYYQAYREHVGVTLDSVTGIVTLVARAFRPDDAKNMAMSLLQISDTFVNGLNSRANRDAQNFASSFLAQSQLELANVESELADYRNTQMILDPGKESEASLSQLSKMTTEITRMEAALSQQRAVAPNSPTLNPLAGQIQAYREQVAALRKTIVGDPQSVVSKIKDYELLALRRDIAGKKIALATAQYEKTRQEAQNHRIYLQTVVAPNSPDRPQLPYRFLMTLAVAVLAFAAYTITKHMVAATMEHQE
ncbi:capsular polysaccharide transport system permease protein [Agrobacterium vitis]|nr:capsular polysaccharide transport system permease protein [Agrobacterium vitis]MBE1436497.1 capsular polysaccharide transport system permease protein [Agrobacterium vitis]